MRRSEGKCYCFDTPCAGISPLGRSGVYPFGLRQLFCCFNSVVVTWLVSAVFGQAVSGAHLRDIVGLPGYRLLHMSAVFRA